MIVLSLPWELIRQEGEFLVREGRVDLARSIPGDFGPDADLRPPSDRFKLVVNVSAPAGAA